MAGVEPPPPSGGIPRVQFIEDVGAFMKGKEVDQTITELEQLRRQYRVLEQQVAQRKVRLLAKLPEIQKSLDAVTMLQAQRSEADSAKVDFELGDGVYAKASLNAVDAVSLWLGANIMVEYPLDEAKELLEENLKNCKANLKTSNEDQDLLKDLITTTEVSMARVYNWGVEQKRAKGGGKVGVGSS